MGGKITGWPAFPGMTGEEPGTTHPGMTLRDYFAGQALAGLASLYAQAGGTSEEIVMVNARLAYLMADAMLARRQE